MTWNIGDGMTTKLCGGLVVIFAILFLVFLILYLVARECDAPACPAATIPPTTSLIAASLPANSLSANSLPANSLPATSLPSTSLPITVVAPTTVAPTTVAPTTIAPTTAAPTTAPPNYVVGKRVKLVINALSSESYNGIGTMKVFDETGQNIATVSQGARVISDAPFDTVDAGYHAIKNIIDDLPNTPGATQQRVGAYLGVEWDVPRKITRVEVYIRTDYANIPQIRQQITGSLIRIEDGANNVAFRTQEINTPATATSRGYGINTVPQNNGSALIPF